MPMSYIGCPDHDLLVRLLWHFHSRTLTHKNDNNLWSPAVFDPSSSEQHNRGRNNIKYLQHIWLDFEDGDLQPDELPKLFPNLRMVVTNTFHHTDAHPRFRVIILTSTAMTPATYELLYEQIALKLEDVGYSIERRGRGRKPKKTNKLRSGLDWSKRLPTSLFYLPCQAENSPDSFFIDYDEPGRIPLDPLPWIQNAHIPLQPELSGHASSSADRTKIDVLRVGKAKAQWRMAPKGTGNDAFFHLGLECKLARMNRDQIASILKEEVRFARSPQDRQMQIPGILISLEQKGRNPI
jgi:hypothetical protein